MTGDMVNERMVPDPTGAPKPRDKGGLDLFRRAWIFLLHLSFFSSGLSLLVATSAWGTADLTYLPARPEFSASSSCNPIDLRNEAGPYRAQGETSYCYAYTSAVLIRQRTGVDVSALDLASAFYFGDVTRIEASRDPRLQQFAAEHSGVAAWMHDFRYFAGVDIEKVDGAIHPMFHRIEGGYEAGALLLANLQGLCTEESFPSDGGFEHHDTVVKKLEMAALTHAHAAGPEVSTIDPRFCDPEADIFNTGWLRELKHGCIRRPSPVTLVPVEFSIASSLKDYRLKSERGAVSDADRRQLMSSLDFALEHRRVVAIGYNLDANLDPDAILAAQKSQPPEADPDAADHSSVIIARRFEGGGCHYLIRDPSGFECDEYRGDLRARCRDHEIWLTARELFRSSFYGLVYLR